MTDNSSSSAQSGHLDVVPILKSLDKPCTKTFTLDDGKLSPKDNSHAFRFDLKEEGVSSLADLSNLLSELEQDTQSVIIRGESVDTAPMSSIKRRNENFTKASRQWCLIDIDDVSIPDNFSNWSQHLQGLVRVATEQLPAEFQGVDCWYQFSSSMGIKEGKVRVHLWYWLSRKVSDEELKAWLSESPVDLRLYHPIQMHYVAKPIFVDGANDPLPNNRSGLFSPNGGVDIVVVPSDLPKKAAAYIQRPRHVRTNGVVEAQEIIRDPDSGRVIDGRERLLFDLSNEVTSELVRSGNKQTPTEDQIADLLWERFTAEADLSDNKWSKDNALTKARARLREIDEKEFSFTARGETNALLPVSKPYYTPNLTDASGGTEALQGSLNEFFDSVEDGKTPRHVIKITMGAGKTTQTIKRLKQFLRDKSDQRIEIYVPRHDIAEEYVERLKEQKGENEIEAAVNASVIHVLPRTGGRSDPDTGRHQFQILCDRADYVRSLESSGHSVYNTACQRDGELCDHFSACKYLDQFREPLIPANNVNTIRIYQHTHIGLPRNTFEDEQQPDLVIVDESVLPSLITTDQRVSLEALREHLKTPSGVKVGDIIANALRDSQPVLEALRGGEIIKSDLASIDLKALEPSLGFEATSRLSTSLKPVKEYHALRQVIRILKQEWSVDGRDEVERLVYDPHDQTVRICHLRETRIPDTAPTLFLDATADQMLIEKVFGAVTFDQIDIEQRAFTSQVYDHRASNTWWKDYPDRIDELVQALNLWVDYKQTPLCVSHKGLADQLREREDLNSTVKIMNFGGLRGSNEAEDCSVVFITGRNQPPQQEVDYKARALFWDEPSLKHEDMSDHLPLEVRGYFPTVANSHTLAGVQVRAFSDPRIEALHAQDRENETVQAIARLRLVHSKKYKRVFLLGNLPTEIPVDQLITLQELMPNELEKELLDKGNLPISAKSMVKLRPDLAGRENTASKKIKRSNVSNPQAMAKILPELMLTSVFVATYKAGDKRKTEHKHLFLPNRSSFKHGVNDGAAPSLDEVKSFLESGWEEIEDLKVDFWFNPGAEDNH